MHILLSTFLHIQLRCSDKAQRLHTRERFWQVFLFNFTSQRYDQTQTDTLTLLLYGQKRDPCCNCGAAITNTLKMSVHVEFTHTTPTYLSVCISGFCVMPQLHYTPEKMQNSDSPKASHPSPRFTQCCSAFMRRADSLLWGFELVTKCAALQQTAIKLFYVIEVNLSTLQELLLGPKSKIWSGSALNLI